MSEPTERLLPQNIEAELGVLGSLLIDPSCAIQVVSILKAEDFYREQHRQIYAAIADLWAARTPADSITLTDELNVRGHLDAAAQVHTLGYAVPTAANAEYYARIVTRCAVMRRLISAAGQIAAIAYSEPDADVATAEAHHLIRQASTRRAGKDSTPIEAVIDQAIDEHVTAMEQNTPVGMLYGLTALRKALTGLMPGELAYVIGRPGSGKSALMATLAWQEAHRRAMEGAGSVAYITLEMKATQVMRRILSGFAEIDTRVMRAHFKRADGSINDAAWAAFRKTAMETRERLRGRMRFWDTPIQPSQIRAQLEHEVSERDCRVAFIDYVGLISPETTGRQRQDEYQRLTNISRELKQLAQELNIPIVCLAQMNRQSEHRPNPRPVESDIRDAGGLEQDGDFVFGIYRGAKYMPKRAELDEKFAQFMELIVLKGRDTDSMFTIPLRFEGPYTRVSDWPQEWDYRTYLTLTPSDDDKRQGQQGGEY